MPEEVLVMACTVEAAYEVGVLKPVEPLPLKEHEKFCITVEAARPPIWVPIAARAAEGASGRSGQIAIRRRGPDRPLPVWPSRRPE
jgi:predicted DNA-binding antitoxin AbrB/MazE fold protein